MLYDCYITRNITLKSIIKQIRKESLMSQKEFAEKLEVSFATVNRWENGKSTPSYEALRRLKKYCELYNINIDIRKLAEEKEE